MGVGQRNYRCFTCEFLRENHWHNEAADADPFTLKATERCREIGAQAGVKRLKASENQGRKVRGADAELNCGLVRYPVAKQHEVGCRANAMQMNAMRLGGVCQRVHQTLCLHSRQGRSTWNAPKRLTFIWNVRRWVGLNCGYLLTQTQAADQVRVTGAIFAGKVAKQAVTLANHHEQAAA